MSMRVVFLTLLIVSVSSSKEDANVKKLSEIASTLKIYAELDSPHKWTFDMCVNLVDQGMDFLQTVSLAMEDETPLDNDAYDSLTTKTAAAGTFLRTCLDALVEDGVEKHGGRFAKLVCDLHPLAHNCKLTAAAISRFDERRISQNKGGFPLHRFTAAGDLSTLLSGIPDYRRLRVAQDGTGNFSNINDALAAAPTGSDSYFLISIAKGTYKEYVTIPRTKTYIIFAGEGQGRTIIAGNHSNTTNWSTFLSATVVIDADHFIGYNMTIENTAGPEGYQAVAMRCSGDFAAFYRCTFEGYQDTLYAHAQKQFYSECDIYGTVDFIFGNALAIFQHCNIIVRAPLIGQSNTIVAQKNDCPHYLGSTTIQGCVVTSAPDLSNNTKTYLGRPWGMFSRVAFMQNRLDAMIDSAGWLDWIGKPNDVYLGEYNNTGPGAYMSGRVKWPGVKSLNSTGAHGFTVDSEFNGGTWVANTLIPYDKGFSF